MTADRQPLEAYLERVMALKDEREARLSSDELREIALEVGVDESDLAAAEAAAADHFERGQGFLDHDRFGDAVAELEEAVALAPGRVEWLHALAKAYAGRWRETLDRADRARAEQLARECLEIEPRHDASFELLNRLDALPASRLPAAPVAAPTSAAPRSRRRRFFTLGSATALLAAAVAWNVDRQLTNGSASPTPANGTKASRGAATEPGALEVPVTLDPWVTGVVLGLDVRQSRLTSYPNGKSYYALSVVLSNRGATELDKVAVRLELLDEAGDVVHRDVFDAISSADPVLRPRDVKALYRLREAAANVRRARLVVEAVDQDPAAPTYAPGRRLDFEWRVPRPPDLQVAFRERGLRFSESVFPKDGSGYFDAVLEVENTGQRTIRVLQVVAEIVGPDGRWTVSDEKYAVPVNAPALRSGEVRLQRFIKKVDEQPEGYRLAVVGVR